MKTRTHFWLITIFIFYTMGLAQDLSNSNTLGQPPEAVIDLIISEEQNQVRTFELRLEPPDSTRGALFISLYDSTNPKATFRRSLLAVEPGVYRFQHGLETGQWRVYMRYGNGIALRHAWLDIEIATPSKIPKKTQIPFYRVLAPGVPDSVQPLGYATFGIILFLACLAIGWVLNQGALKMNTNA